jgi:hypothetical protein
MARARSTTGLHLLDAQTRVVLTGTPYHQDSLAWYTPPDDGPPSQVVVELVPALLWSGDQAGWWGIEVRLDGYRVGELTHPEAGWYWPTVDRMLRAGRRPGAEAHVVIGETGLLEVELYLPVAGEPAAEAPYPGTATDADGRSGVPLWMGVAAAALAVVMIASVAADRINRFEPVTASPATATVLSLAAEIPSSPPSVEPVPVPAPAPAVTPSAAPPQVAVAAAPRPRATSRRLPVVAKPKPKPKLAPKAAPKPKPRPVLKAVVEPEPTKPAKTTTPKAEKPRPEKPKPEKPEKPKPEKPEKPQPEKPKPDEPEKPDPKPDQPEKPGSDEPSGSGSSTPDDESSAGDD